CPTSFFASVGQAGFGSGISPNPPAASTRDSGTKPSLVYSSSKYVLMPEAGLRSTGSQGLLSGEAVEGDEEGHGMKSEKKMKGFKLKFKIGNPSLRRLMSGAIAGVVSRTAVASLETIRTHLMVGSCGHTSLQVFQSIMETDGWKGLFRGNFVNIIRVAPSKAIEGTHTQDDITSTSEIMRVPVEPLFAYDTVKKQLSPKSGEQPKIPIPASSIAGAVAGVSSTLCTYPLELLKTRLTVQGLTPSLIGVIPYAATNYLAYDTLRKAYKKGFSKEDIGNVMTLVIGSAVLWSLNLLIYNQGLGPSCLKLVPAAGISFMCYEACKRILVANEQH
ncbi:hypothetical protein PHAVU_003G163800, partial [Phaseolus vulgaris]